MARKKKTSSKKSRRVKTVRAFKSAITYNPRRRVAVHRKTMRKLYLWSANQWDSSGGT